MNVNIHRFGVATLLGLLPSCGDIADSADQDVSTVEQTLRGGGGHGHGHHAPHHGDIPLTGTCEDLLASLQYPSTVFESATSVAEGELFVPGQVLPAHCLIVGKMNARVSPIDGQAYAIGFEMRLPLEWSRRFF